MRPSGAWIQNRIRLGTPEGGLYGEQCGVCREKIFPPRDICPKKDCGTMVSPRGLYPERFIVEEFEEGWGKRNAEVVERRRG